jgi:Transcriptional regulators
MIGLMLPAMDPDSPAVQPCAAVDDPATAELTWLMQRATRVLADDFDDLARREGLVDMRDCLVLAVIADGVARSQLEISRSLGIDKTTLVVILDRLASKGLIVREQSAADRRVRIPRITDDGQKVLDTVMAAREAGVQRRLDLLPDGEAEVLRRSLWRIATSRD